MSVLYKYCNTPSKKSDNYLIGKGERIQMMFAWNQIQSHIFLDLKFLIVKQRKKVNKIKLEKQRSMERLLSKFLYNNKKFAQKNCFH